jgi:hydroxymethylbilane synthase
MMRQQGDLQPQEIYDAAVQYATTALPEWTPIPGSVEDALLQASASMTGQLLGAINHEASAIAVNCERAFLAGLDGSCRTPLAGHAVIDNGVVRFRGHALTLDGAHCFETTRQGSPADAERMGREAGEQVKADGGSLIAF